MNKGRGGDRMKKILLAIILVICFCGVAYPQNIICPEKYYFPETINDSLVMFNGTWWTPTYDPLNPNTSFYLLL